MKFIGLVLAGVLFISSLAGAVPSQDYLISYMYQEKVPNRETLTTMTLKYCLHNDQKLRIDYPGPGGTVRLSRIFDRETGLVRTLYAFSQQYQEESFEKGTWEMIKGGFAFEWDPDNCRKIGETKLLNYPCEIRQMQKNGKITTAYIVPELNVVLKAEIKDNGKTVLMMEATEFRPEKTAASFFDIPAGYTKAK